MPSKSTNYVPQLTSAVNTKRGSRPVRLPVTSSHSYHGHLARTTLFSKIQKEQMPCASCTQCGCTRVSVAQPGSPLAELGDAELSALKTFRPWLQARGRNVVLVRPDRYVAALTTAEAFGSVVTSLADRHGGTEQA